MHCLFSGPAHASLIFALRFALPCATLPPPCTRTPLETGKNVPFHPHSPYTESDTIMARNRPTPADFHDPLTEEWKVITFGISDFDLSNHGRMRRLDESRKLIGYRFTDNDIPKFHFQYRTVPGGVRFTKTLSVPKLVAKHFLPYSEMPLLKHRDGNRINCRADNLYWSDYEKRSSTVLMDGGLTRREYMAKLPGITIEEQYASGAWTYDYTVQKHKEAGITRPFTMERRPDLPNQENIPHYHRRSIPLAEWEASKTYNTAPPTHLYPDTANDPPRYVLSTVPQMDARGNPLPTPFPVFPEKQPEEDERDIEDSGLYFSQARVADRAYTALFHNPSRTQLEDAALKNLKKVLDYE
jgi:hypothetical protein